MQRLTVEMVVDFPDLDQPPARLAAADARDDDCHQLDRVAERHRARSGAEQLDEGDELRAECRVSVGELEREIALRAVGVDRAEAAGRIVNRGERHLHAAAVREVDNVGAGLVICLRADEAGTEHGVDRLKRVDAVALPCLAGETREPAQFAELFAALRDLPNLRRVTHPARREDRLSLEMPAEELIEVGDIRRHRLVHEDRHTRFDKRTRTAHMIVTVVRRDDRRVHMPDHILGPRDDVLDQRSLRDRRRIGGIVRPDVRHTRAGDADGFKRLSAEIFRDACVRAFRHLGGIVAIHDRRP